MKPGFAIFALSGLAGAATLLSTTVRVDARCDPGRPHLVIGSHYQGGDQAAQNVFEAGVNLTYYTPWVDYTVNSSSSAWDLLSDLSCTTSASVMLGQVGFLQLTSDNQDWPFYEYSHCQNPNILYAPVEVRTLPAASARFNIEEVRTVFNHQLYLTLRFFENTSLMASVDVDWQEDGIVLAAEVHAEDDQGYGGWQNRQTWTQLQYSDTSGVGHEMQLGLTPNNVQSANQTTHPFLQTEAWLPLSIPTQDGFSSYDSVCSG